MGGAVPRLSLAYAGPCARCDVGAERLGGATPIVGKRVFCSFAQGEGPG